MSIDWCRREQCHVVRRRSRCSIGGCADHQLDRSEVAVKSLRKRLELEEKLKDFPPVTTLRALKYIVNTGNDVSTCTFDEDHEPTGSFLRMDCKGYVDITPTGRMCVNAKGLKVLGCAEEIQVLAKQLGVK
jgi:hypothetical protein